MMYNRESLLKEIMEIDFTLKELNLYLDTHPTDMNALSAYNVGVGKRRAAVAHYEKIYGPIQLGLCEEREARWQWIDEPWPWENMDDCVEKGGKANVEL